MKTKEDSSMKSNKSEDANIEKEKQSFHVAEEQGEDYSIAPLKKIYELDKKIQERFEKFEKRLDKSEEKLITDKASLITVFGVFASIVAFLSMEIQILKTVCSFWKVVGFSLISLASLLAFNIILHFIGQSWVKSDQKQTIPIGVSIIVGILFLLGMAFSTIGNEKSCSENAIYKKYEDDFLDKRLEFEKEYNSKIKNLQNQINKLMLRIRS